MRVLVPTGGGGGGGGGVGGPAESTLRIGRRAARMWLQDLSSLSRYKWLFRLFRCRFTSRLPRSVNPAAPRGEHPQAPQDFTRPSTPLAPAPEVKARNCALMRGFLQSGDIPLPSPQGAPGHTPSRRTISLVIHGWVDIAIAEMAAPACALPHAVAEDRNVPLPTRDPHPEVQGKLAKAQRTIQASYNNTCTSSHILAF